MKRHIITGAVLLFLICFFFINSGQAGCAPTPSQGVIEITGDPLDPDQKDADVYGSGKKAKTNANAKAVIGISWFPFLQGEKPTGLITILSPKNPGKHYHVPYELEDGKICEIYGWAIQETGKYGRGTRFTMTIQEQDKNGKPNYHVSKEE